MPPALTDWAVDLLYHHAKSFPYGKTWEGAYNNEPVLAIKEHHNFTHRNGQLVYGCYMGVTLYRSGVAAVGEPAPTPDNVAMYTDDRGIDWPLVGLSALAGAAVVGAFIFVTKTSPKKHVTRALERLR